jgi:hypothetical protein
VTLRKTPFNSHLKHLLLVDNIDSEDNIADGYTFFHTQTSVHRDCLGKDKILKKPKTARNQPSSIWEKQNSFFNFKRFFHYYFFKKKQFPNFYAVKFQFISKGILFSNYSSLTVILLKKKSYTLVDRVNTFLTFQTIVGTFEVQNFMEGPLRFQKFD